MEDGDIVAYLETHQSANRQLFVSAQPSSVTALTSKTQLFDIASGLSYLHEQGIFHGDLKGVSDPRSCMQHSRS
jgi:serine/threonine protein kinase